MIACSTVTKAEIRRHYDWATPFYRLLWGAHIHHGLWQANETPRQAQHQLITSMIQRAGVIPETRVLDVGCGMGGSSIELVKLARCHVTGVTLSPVQQVWASSSARWQGVGDRARFLCADAEAVQFPRESFDVVWSIECTEHLFDKASFVRSAAGWLVPGGRMAICAWLAGDDDLDAARARQVDAVCEGFLCPSLGAAEDYRRWAQAAGLVLRSVEDWTEQTMRTWEICQARVKRSGVRWLAHALPAMVRFLDSFELILNAYRTRAMRYGCLVFEKPAD